MNPTELGISSSNGVEDWPPDCRVTPVSMLMLSTKPYLQQHCHFHLFHTPSECVGACNKRSVVILPNIGTGPTSIVRGARATWIVNAEVEEIQIQSGDCSIIKTDIPTIGQQGD